MTKFVSAAKEANVNLKSLPYSIRDIAINLFNNGNDLTPIANWQANNQQNGEEVPYKVNRVLLQDFTGVPFVADAAAYLDAAEQLGLDTSKIGFKTPVNLVIDHSVQVDKFGTDSALDENIKIEYQRNGERYEFLKWADQSFNGFSAVPPGIGIVHQVNLEYLSPVVAKMPDGSLQKDCIVGTDSHTTMINGIGVLGWGVGGIEAVSGALGEPLPMNIPDVVGMELTGKLNEGVTATDLVLTITQILREHGVTGKFVEFYGNALDNLSVADRATIANMAPEYGATVGYFPVDGKTIDYLELTNRSNTQEVQTYCEENELFRNAGDNLKFTVSLELKLEDVQPSISGPIKPQQKITLKESAKSFDELVNKSKANGKDNGIIKNGDVMIAAITSCTNTSNPYVMVQAGLIAKKAIAAGLKIPEYVKTSLAPGSQVVSEYLESAGLQDDLDALGFNIVGFGCTTCIGNSGPLADKYEQDLKDNPNTIAASVLSGNRNFEARIHQNIKANYLMSPPLVILFALAGNMNIDLENHDFGNGITFQDLWPSFAEVEKVVNANVTQEKFAEKYNDDALQGNAAWQALPSAKSALYDWNAKSTYIQKPPYFEELIRKLKAGEAIAPVKEIRQAKPLLVLGDSVTTDHISPAGSIPKDSEAGQYLIDNGIEHKDFNSYGSRRGNHNVMIRGTFANVRIKNLLADGKIGGFTKTQDGRITSIYQAAQEYKAQGTQLVVVAGIDYGMGSSRDWAAKGTKLLGVEAVLAESYERIHRSNLIGMGVLPLQFKGKRPENVNEQTVFDILDIDKIGTGSDIKVLIDGKEHTLTVRIDTEDELKTYNSLGIMQKSLLGEYNS